MCMLKIVMEICYASLCFYLQAFVVKNVTTRCGCFCYDVVVFITSHYGNVILGHTIWTIFWVCTLVFRFHCFLEFLFHFFSYHFKSSLMCCIYGIISQDFKLLRLTFAIKCYAQEIGMLSCMSSAHQYVLIVINTWGIHNFQL